MTEKDLLLNDKEIYMSFAHLSQPRSHPVVHKAIAKAQLAKDQAYYQPLLAQKDEEIKKLNEALARLQISLTITLNQQGQHLKQAKQKAREELVKEIEKQHLIRPEREDKWQAIRGEK